MLKPVIDLEICHGCDPCLARFVCKTRAIMQIDPGDSPIIELGRCNHCADCVLACCCEAITMKSNPT